MVTHGRGVGPFEIFTERGDELASREGSLRQPTELIAHLIAKLKIEILDKSADFPVVRLKHAPSPIPSSAHFCGLG